MTEEDAQVIALRAIRITVAEIADSIDRTAARLETTLSEEAYKVLIDIAQGLRDAYEIPSPEDKPCP